MTLAPGKTHRTQELIGTMTRPSGVSDTGISLRFAKASAIAVTTCPMASHQPATMIQITFPTSEGMPASWCRTMVRPKGHSAKFAMRNEAKPNGIVIISKQHTIPARQYPSAIHKPHSTSQMMLSSVRTAPILPASGLLGGQRANDLGRQAFSDTQPRSVRPGTVHDLPRTQSHTVV